MEMIQTLGINLGMLIAQAINFGILLVVLTYLLYKPVLRVIDERRERVRHSVEHAAALEKQVQEMERERKKQMKEMDDQARTFLEQAKQQAEGAKKEILAQTKTEVDQML